MNKTLLRAGALVCALMSSTALVTQKALAQTAPPPRFNQLDANGVDLVTGDFFFSMVEGTIGSGEGALALVRNWAGPAGWTDNWSGALYTRTIGGTALTVVEFGSYSDTFSISGGAYTSTKADGATLTDLGGGFRYTTSNGTQIDFASVSELGYPIKGPACSRADNGSCAIPTAIRRPNGMTHILSWDVEERCFQFDSELQCISSGAYPRFRGVSNSANYSFTIGYLTNTPGSGVPVSNWFVRTGAQFTNLDTAPGSLPTVTYSSPASGVTEVTDTGGLVWRLTNGSAGRLTGIRRPGAGSDTTAIAYTSGATTVASVTSEGVATGYAWSGSGTRTATVTDAASQASVIVSDLSAGRVTSATDPLSRQTSFQYDGNGRLTRLTRPEGNSAGYTYDARGNVTEIRLREKDDNGDTGDDIVTTASYDSSCSNVVTCNQPNSVTDARGNTTDFTYDSTHGGLLTVTGPAPSTGATRPQVRYAYSQVTAVSGQPVTLPTAVSACQAGTASSCVGTADEMRTVTAYDSDNLRVASVTQRNGDNSLSATSAFTYDAIGNALTVDGPLSGSADTTRLRYDSARRTIGAIGPDPDGGGSLKHRALRTTYSSGLPTSVEAGTVDSQSDADWAAFAPLQRAEQDYDANARPIVSRVMAGSTTYALSQTGYDSLGRIRCVAQRMNPSEFASLPSDACALDTEGSYGPDRISRTTYDAAGQVTKVETGVGVTGVAADEVRATYTGNGLVQTLTDANGNASYFHYEVHDRLQYWVMPSATATGNWDWGNIEYYGYDANGNRTLLVRRDGNSTTFSYDNLNRVTAKDPPGSEPTVSYGYDLLGRMTSAATSAQTLTFAFDALGRNTSQAGPHGTVTYAYDLADRRTLMTYADSGLVVGYGYDVAGDMTEIRENPSGGNVLLGSYAYDDLGRRTSLTRGNGAVTSYAYDNASRLTQLVQNLNGTSNDLTLDFTLSPASEIVSNTRSNDAFSFTHANANVSSTVNGLNQVTAQGGTSVSHDARGNVSAIGSASYGYDSENRLTSAPSSVTFGHDPLGRLYYSTGDPQLTRFAYDGDALIAEYDSGMGLLRRYVNGPGIDEPLVWYEGTGTTTRRYPHADERGSVIAVSDGSGNLVGSAPNRYDEYGVPQGTLTGRFGHTGQMWLPEVGLYHYRARTYNPAMGRFMQTDPIGYEAGMNLYAYVGNNPVNARDPSGLCSFTLWGHYEATQGSDGQPSGPWKLMYTFVTQDSACDSPSTSGGGGVGGVGHEAGHSGDDNEVVVVGNPLPRPPDFEPPRAGDLFIPAGVLRPHIQCSAWGDGRLCNPRRPYTPPRYPRDPRTREQKCSDARAAQNTALIGGGAGLVAGGIMIIMNASPQTRGGLMIVNGAWNLLAAMAVRMYCY